MDKPNEPKPGWCYVIDWAKEQGYSRERGYQIAKQIGGVMEDGRWIMPIHAAKEFRNRALRWANRNERTTVSAILYTKDGRCPRCHQINTVMGMNFPEDSRVCMACKILFTPIKAKVEDRGL